MALRRKEPTSSFKRVPKQFFGMHLKTPTTPAHVDMGYGSLRLWDSRTAWRDIEPSSGVFDFAQLDQFVKLAEQHGWEITLVLGQAPNWATGADSSGTPTGSYNTSANFGIGLWERYIEKVARRYKGRIKYYEVWNEINLAQFWKGTVAQAAELTKSAYRTIKSVDPDALVLSANVTAKSGVTVFDQYVGLAKGHFDIVSTHLYVYPEPPEEIIALAKQYRDVMKKHGIGHLPLWSTECTWNTFNLNGTTQPDTTVLPDDLAVSYLTRMFLAHVIADVDRCFFYGMDHAWSNLRLINMATPTEKTAAGRAFGRVVEWLVNTQISEYNVTADGIHYVVAQFDNKDNGYIAWREDHASQPKRFSSNLRVCKGMTAAGVNVDSDVSKLYGLTQSAQASFTLDKTPVKLITSHKSLQDVPALKEEPISRSDLGTINITSLLPAASGAETTYFYRNPFSFPVDVFIWGGTVTVLSFSRDGQNWVQFASAAPFVTLSPGDRLQIRYTTKPNNVVAVPR